MPLDSNFEIRRPKDGSDQLYDPEASEIQRPIVSEHPLAKAVLARFPGATLTSITDRATGVTVNLGEPKPKANNAVISGYHQINAACFSALAPDLVNRGWSVFPQTRDERRGPGIIDRQALRWGEYKERLPTSKEIAWWSAFCPSHNVAAIMGPSSGGAFALDIDVSDIGLSDAVQATADRILGYTPLRRTGRFPRAALIYRQALGGVPADQVIRNGSTNFVLQDGQDKPDAIEILAEGKPLTFFGLHHKTGRYFIWSDRMPHTDGPETAPLVTLAQLDVFMDEVNRLRPLSRAVRGQAPSQTWTFDAEAGLHRVRELGEVKWSVSEGRVTSGREAFIFALVSATVRANETAARDPKAGRMQLCALVEREFAASADYGGKWTPLAVKKVIAAKVESSCRHYLDNGGFRAVRPGPAMAVDGEGVVIRGESRVEDEEPEIIPELAHLRTSFLSAFLSTRLPRMARERKSYEILLPVDRTRAAERALILDEPLRIEAAKAATATIRRHLDRWIEGLYDRAVARRALRGDAKLDAAPIQILKGDAGSGKTSGFWRALARAKQVRGSLGFPIGFAMPSHANIEDSLTAAVEAQLAWEQSCDAAVVEAEKVGLKALVFRGKLRTNCGFKTQMAALRAASIKSDGLCKSRRNANENIPGAEPEWEDVLCPMWAECEYQRSVALLADADVVLFASAYVAVSAPAALTNALLGLVIDERPYGGLLATNSKEPLPVAVLSLPRPAPRLLDVEMREFLGKSNAKEAIEAARIGFLADRDEAVRIVMPGLREIDAGKAVLALHNHRVGNRRAGLEAARSAYEVCRRSSNAAKDVKPGMTEKAAQELAGAPRGAGLQDERRFWKLVVERLENLQHDEENPGSPRKARGASDARIQAVKDKKLGLCIRLSWRGTPSFPDVPLMMLDASAAPQVVEKVWAGRVVETLDVQAPCHMRVVLVTGSTFSDYSMIPSRAKREKDGRDASSAVHLHREVITRLAGVHGYGKLLVGGNLPVMSVLRSRWLPPVNTDFVHNGAMRGLDQFRNHAAALLLGRLELPPRAIDAYVACLTYDDDKPEEPVDRLGTGKDEDSKPLRPIQGVKEIAMRNGRNISVPDSIYEGAWAKIMRAQYREEEVRQFAARLRPVHRLGRPPVAYIANSAIPEGMIVDDTIDIKALRMCRPAGSGGVRGRNRPFEIARVTEGVLDQCLGWQGRPDLLFEGFGEDWPSLHLNADRLDRPGDPESQGTTRIRWRMPGGEWATGSVLTILDDPAAALARVIAGEQGLSVDEVLEVLEVETLWEGTPRAPSGTKPPDKIDWANTGLPEGSTREEIRAALADQEAIDLEAMVDAIRSELSGLPLGTPDAEIDEALRAKRIPAIDWDRILPYPGADRKLDGVPLAVRIIMSRYAGCEAEDEEDFDD